MDAVQANQTKRSEEQGELDKFIDGSSYEGMAALLAGIEICLFDVSLAEKVAEKLRNKFAFLEGKTAGNAASEAGLDLELEPALRWKHFMDGFIASKKPKREGV